MGAPFQPTISVVIPAFNRSDVIVRAVKSALEQSYPPLEVIVVDDASTDHTPDTARAIGDERVRVICSQQNGGGSVARNIGIDAALGDYIALLDSDDAWYADKLARQVVLLADCAERERQICYTNLNHRGPRRDRPWNKHLYDPACDLSDYLVLERQAIQTSTILMSTALARKVRFDERLRCHQDWDFVLRAKAAGALFLGTMDVLVDYDAKQPVGRVSEQRTAKYRRLWQQLAQPLLSEKANATFYASEVFPRLDTSELTFAAWRELLRGAFPGRAAPTLIFGEAMKRILAKDFVDFLRRTKRRLTDRGLA